MQCQDLGLRHKLAGTTHLQCAATGTAFLNADAMDHDKMNVAMAFFASLPVPLATTLICGIACPLHASDPASCWLSCRDPLSMWQVELGMESLVSVHCSSRRMTGCAMGLQGFCVDCLDTMAKKLNPHFAGSVKSSQWTQPLKCSLPHEDMQSDCCCWNQLPPLIVHHHHHHVNN